MHLSKGIPMNLEKEIVTLEGDFRRASVLDKGSWLSAADITKDRITDIPLRGKSFYTNNHALYDLEGGKAFLFFGSNDSSIFRNETIDAAFNQLTSDEAGHFYRPSVHDVSKAKENSLTIPIRDLGLKFSKPYHSYGYFEIDTSDTKAKTFKTPAQLFFAEAVFGSMVQHPQGKSDYCLAMEMFSRNGIKNVRVYSLSEETVLKNASGGAIARACWLKGFGYSGFYAYVRCVYGLGAVRGKQSILQGKHEEAIHAQPGYNYPLISQLARVQVESIPQAMRNLH